MEENKAASAIYTTINYANGRREAEVEPGKA
jgi:hypothetical protein